MMDSRNRSGPRRLGWLGLSLCFAALAGCVNIQVGWPGAPPAGAAGGPPSGLQQAAYHSAAPPVAAPSGPSGPAYPGQVIGPAGPARGEPGMHGMPLSLASLPPMGGPPPTEIAKRSLPPYVVEPPDILILDAIRLVPRPPYVVGPLDVLLVRVAEPKPNEPIDGTYTVAPDGTINLGYSYGLVRVGGLTLDQVERAIRQQVGRILNEPKVAVGLAQFRGVQQVRGEHLVRPDGTINLGSYGCVYVVGLTLAEVKIAVERHLSQYVLDPEVNVDVLAYNS
ncbi:MAG: polysaccharide biosynthesis/export family protein, partial [Gemmataceae bacterium]|nr:polysaccharide biosynthesis/export family protein [Gemmataceae bacterium]